MTPSRLFLEDLMERPFSTESTLLGDFLEGDIEVMPIESARVDAHDDSKCLFACEQDWDVDETLKEACLELIESVSGDSPEIVTCDEHAPEVVGKLLESPVLFLFSENNGFGFAETIVAMRAPKQSLKTVLIRPEENCPASCHLIPAGRFHYIPLRLNEPCLDDIVSCREFLNESPSESTDMDGECVDTPGLQFRRVLEEALDHEELGLIPQKLLKEASEIVKSQEARDFLLIMDKLSSSTNFVPSENHFIGIYNHAKSMFGESTVLDAIVDLAMARRPNSKRIERLYVSHLCHSSQAPKRRKGIEIVEQKLLHASDLRDSDDQDDMDVHLIAVMLDAFHEDGEHEQALEISESLLKRFPDSDVAIRNHARAMQRVEKYTQDEVLAEYRRALMCPDASDETAKFYSFALRHYGLLVDSVEAAAYACFLDLDDPKNFGALALAIAEAITPRNLRHRERSGRAIPDAINAEAASRCVAFVTGFQYDFDAKGLWQRAIDVLGVSVDEIEQLIDELGEPSRSERANFVKSLYDLLRSNVTQCNDKS